MQKLILPINQCRLTASMKTDAYLQRFGLVHYGVDMVSSAGDRTLWASGDGLVMAVGNDNIVGKVIAVLYRGAADRTSGQTTDVVFRYYHLESIKIRAGDKVTKDTQLGVYGNTGSMQMAYHLHLEADLDTVYPLYSPTVSSSSFIKGRVAGANDKTMRNPLAFLHYKASKPDNQTYSHANDDYIRPEDKTITMIQ